MDKSLKVGEDEWRKKKRKEKGNGVALQSCDRGLHPLSFSPID